MRNIDMDLETLRADYQRLKLLHEISDVIHSTLDPKQALELILQQAVKSVGASSGSIVLVNPNNKLLEIEAASGLSKEAKCMKLRIGEGITGWVARTRKPARVGSVQNDPRYVMLRPNVCSELAIPLEVAGELRGVLNVDSDRVDAFTAADQELLEAVAIQAAKVIHNTWLYEQVRLKARMLETLVSISRTINSQVNVNEVLQGITREACTLMGAKMCSLLMLDSSGEWLELRACSGAGQAYTQKPKLSITESFLGTVIRRKKPSQLENVQHSGRYQNVEVARQENLVSLLSVPLLFGGKAMGTLNVYTGEPHIFSNDEVHALCALAELSAIAFEKARLYERIVDVEEHLRQNEKLSALGLLAAEVAHEIRNPLTVMKMLYHSLGLQFSPDDPRSKDDAIFREKMDHLNKIVEQTLDFARSAEPQMGPVNVNELIDELGLLIRHKLRNSGIQLVRELAPDLPTVAADRIQLAQAFLNLTLNALEAMPHGGTLTVIAKAVKHHETSSPAHVVIEFRDTGKGMSQEQQNQAFGSLLNTTKTKGTGLGLAIVRKIIEAHHGTVEIRSRQGHGTSVRLQLPANG